MNPRIQAHQEVVGSFVVFDPTGRDLRRCYRVGCVESVRWDDADDGNADGSPRPILTVRDNLSGEVWGVAKVAAVLRDRDMSPVTLTLTKEQAVLVSDLLSHDLDLLSQVTGYGDTPEGGNDDHGWFDMLTQTTRNAVQDALDNSEVRA